MKTCRYCGKMVGEDTVVCNQCVKDAQKIIDTHPIVSKHNNVYAFAGFAMWNLFWIMLVLIAVQYITALINGPTLFSYILAGAIGFLMLMEITICIIRRLKQNKVIIETDKEMKKLHNKENN